MSTTQPNTIQTTGPREIPGLTEPRPAVIPEVAERVLSSGLRVLVVRRDAVPLVELRLRIPTVSTPERLSTATLLAETALSGTPTRSNIEIAAQLQGIGGGLGCSIDADRLLFSGSSLATGLPTLLEILSDVLREAAYPEHEVGLERDRVADHIQMALSQPSVLAHRALSKRLYGDHPYAVSLPEPEAVHAVVAPDLRVLHGEITVPEGSVLVLVGDLDPESGLDAVERALDSWRTPGKAATMPEVPGWRTGAWQIVDRPGAVQSSIRIASRVVGRSHPDYPALRLANMIFGGGFPSRLVTNLREEKGYTYSPHSNIDLSVKDSLLLMDVDVATEVTAPALHEIGYELGRIATLPPEAEELEDVRQYAIGTMSLSLATQSGLAGWVTSLAGAGLTVDWLTDHGKRLAAVTLDEVHAAAMKYLAPSKTVTVVLGDAEQITEPLSRLSAVTV